MKTLYWILAVALLALGCSQPSSGGPQPTPSASAVAPQSSCVVTRYASKVDMDAEKNGACIAAGDYPNATQSTLFGDFYVVHGAVTYDNSGIQIREGSSSLPQQPSRLRPSIPTAPPAPAVPDPRTPTQLAQAACTGGKCKGSVAGKQMLGATTQPIIPPSWTVPNWYIDPANSATCASDTNSGTAATCTGGCSGSTCPSGIGPLVTYGELAVHRWGTSAPRLRQNTTILFLSSQSANTDPVILSPSIENGAYVVLQGAFGSAQQVASGTLAGTVPRNRATPQLQQETLAAGLAAGELLQNTNTTHSAFAWLYANPSGNNWTLSQPLTPHVLPDTVLAPTEVTTFANLDAYVVYAPVKVMVSQFTPIATGVQSAFKPSGFLYHLNVFAPGGSTYGTLVIGQGVGMYESSTTTVGISSTGASSLTVVQGLSNSYSDTEIGITSDGPQEVSGAYGGVLTGYDINLASHASLLDGDVIINTFVNYTTDAQLGTVYVDTTGPLTLFGTGNVMIGSAGTIVWGPGTLNNAGRLTYPSGATGGATTFPIAAISLNAQAKGCIAQPGAGAIGACNTAAGTGANLDSANGATTGCLVALGGGSFCNYGP